MDTGELLTKLCVPLPRQELYYLEFQGFVHPEKRRAGKTWRRQWPEDIIPLLEPYWNFRQQGFPPRVAWEKATQLVSTDKED